MHTLKQLAAVAAASTNMREHHSHKPAENNSHNNNSSCCGELEKAHNWTTTQLMRISHSMVGTDERTREHMMWRSTTINDNDNNDAVDYCYAIISIIMMGKIFNFNYTPNDSLRLGVSMDRRVCVKKELRNVRQSLDCERRGAYLSPSFPFSASYIPNVKIFSVQFRHCCRRHGNGRMRRDGIARCNLMLVAFKQKW